MRVAILAAALGLVLSVQTALAAPHVQSATLSTSGSEATVAVRVVGSGNADWLHVNAQVAAVCANGVSFTMGLGATVTTSGGAQEVTLSSGGLGVVMGCDTITSAQLLSAEVS